MSNGSGVVPPVGGGDDELLPNRIVRPAELLPNRIVRPAELLPNRVVRPAEEPPPSEEPTPEDEPPPSVVVDEEEIFRLRGIENHYGNIARVYGWGNQWILDQIGNRQIAPGDVPDSFLKPLPGEPNSRIGPPRGSSSYILGVNAKVSDDQKRDIAAMIVQAQTMRDPKAHLEDSKKLWKDLATLQEKNAKKAADALSGK
jgi:hypothetical protein